MKQPMLTTDLDLARADLDAHGYCLIADVLLDEQVAEARERLVEQADAERALGLSFHDAGQNQSLTDEHGRIRANAFAESNGGINQRLWMLANKGRCFRDMIMSPLVDDLVGHVLGRDLLLSTGSANIARPGSKRMGLHTDQWWMPQPEPADRPGVKPGDISRSPVPGFLDPDRTLGIAPAVVANTMWMLTDFTADNGATEVVPGTHRSGAHPPVDQTDLDIVQPEAPAGSLLVFDGRLWHGTGANVSDHDRLGVLMTFCAPQFRQQENQTLGLDRALWDDLSEGLRRRLGFGVWNAYGRIEDASATMVEPEPQRIGELRPRKADPCLPSATTATCR